MVNKLQFSVRLNTVLCHIGNYVQANLLTGAKHQPIRYPVLTKLTITKKKQPAKTMQMNY